MKGMKEKLNKLRDNGETVYSHSRLSTFHQCQFEYYNTYIKKNKGIPNCYTEIGSEIHDSLQYIYENKRDVDEFKSRFFDKVIELEMIGYDFPNEKIRESFMNDLNHFLDNFNKIDSNFLLEKLIVFEIDDGVFMQGYIDAIKPSNQGKPFVDVIDWKTSSKFSGKKLDEAGRQLLMYKIGLEVTSDFKVDKVMWFMIKYVNVCTMQKNGKVRKKMCNRGKWVKEIRKQIEKELYKLDIVEFEAELLLDKAVEDNNLDDMPQEIKDKFWTEDCFVEYEVNDEKINEFKRYVVNTVKSIESKDKDNEDDWQPVEITKQNSFYCSVLCGHRKRCKYYKEFLEQNANDFEKKKKIDNFDLFN